MSNSLDDLRDVLDGVVREPATAVRADAAAAWREGRRRRVSKRVGVAAVVSAVIGGALATSPLLSRLPGAISPASGSGGTVREHPARLEHAYWDDEQPPVTGPLAGVVRRSAEDKDGWYTVSPKGHLWRLDTGGEAVPSLSPDGSHLAYMRGTWFDATYVVANQVDGTTTRFRQIGTGAHDTRVEDFDDDHRYFHDGQSPTFWSPDGVALLLRVGLTDPDSPEPEPAAAILSTDGTLVTVPQPAGAGAAHPIGWVDAHHVALAASESDQANVRTWIVDIRSGQVVRSFTLEDGGGDTRTDQWLGSLSPDGNELATAAIGDHGIRLYSTRGPVSGDLVTELPTIATTADACQPSWSSSELYVPTYPTPDGNASILARANGEVTIVADPRLDIACSTWARTALDGQVHVSLGARLFGQQNTWLSWHWRVATGSALLAIALSLGIVLLVRRRARPAHSFMS